MENDTTAAISSTELVATAISPDADSENEQELSHTITELWSVHVQAQEIVKKTKADLATVRANLAERLFTMKQLLARPGRGGQWSSFLAQHSIPRTSADRLVAAHEKSINVDGNSTDGAITDEEIEKIAKSVWSRLLKRLMSHREKYQFFTRLIIESGISTEEYEDGILLLDPMYEPETAVPANTLVIEEL